MRTPHRVFALATLAIVLCLSPKFLLQAQAPKVSIGDAAKLSELKLFSAAYGYDTEYLEALLAKAPGAYRAIEPAQEMSSYRKDLPLDAHYVARIATMQVEDCGPCTQLNLRMAIEAGVERELLDTLIQSPEKLPQPLQDIRNHARAVTGAGELDPACVDRLRAHYGEGAFLELAVVITGSRIYPTLKRAMLKNESCILGDLKY